MSHNSTPQLFWRTVPGQKHPVRDILLVSADSLQRAAALLGAPVNLVHECATPALLTKAKEHPSEEVWPASVDTLPSYYDRFVH